MIAAAVILAGLVAVLAWCWTIVRNGFRACERCGLMFSGRKCPSCWRFRK